MAASSFYILYRTPLAETGCIGYPYIYLLVACASRFLIHPKTVSQAMQGYLPLTVQYLCDLWDTMPCHWSPGASQPKPYLGKQRISLGVAIILGINLCSHTQPDCNQFVIHLKFVFIHVNIVKNLLVVKTLIKSVNIFFQVSSSLKSFRQNKTVKQISSPTIQQP